MSINPYPNPGGSETVTEKTVIEYEYDDQGRVSKEIRTETRTVQKPHYGATGIY